MCPSFVSGRFSDPGHVEQPTVLTEPSCMLHIKAVKTWLVFPMAGRSGRSTVLLFPSHLSSLGPAHALGWNAPPFVLEDHGCCGFN